MTLKCWIHLNICSVCFQQFTLYITEESHVQMDLGSRPGTRRRRCKLCISLYSSELNCILTF